MTKTLFTVSLLVLLLSVPAFGASANKSVSIAAGERSNGASTVNGSVTIGEYAIVSGDVRSVNGAIRIERDASVADATTVNGGVKLADGVSAGNIHTVNGAIRVGVASRISGAIEAVNGAISLASETTVASHVSNVNGRIEIVGASVGGNVTTVAGDILLREKARIAGDLIVEKPASSVWNNRNGRKPRIVIGPGSTIVGVITLRREVDLFISDAAEVAAIEGVMTMADAIRFSGEQP